jgi:hypothetical protein
MVRVNETMKFIEEYLLPEEPSVVRFVRDFTCQAHENQRRSSIHYQGKAVQDQKKARQVRTLCSVNISMIWSIIPAMRNRNGKVMDSCSMITKFSYTQ